DKPYRTGKPGCESGGVCHDMVLTVKELREANAALRKDADGLQARAQELDDKASDALKRRNAADSHLIMSTRQEIEKLHAEARAFGNRKPVLLSDYEAELRRE